MRAPRAQTLALLSLAFALPACPAFGRSPQDADARITVVVVQSAPATFKRQYRGSIRSIHHIDVRTLADGQVTAVAVKEGQAVQRGDVLFQLRPPVADDKRPAEDQIKAISIKAPFDGLVGRLPRQLGSTVLTGDTLTTLSDNSVMWVYFNVPEDHYLEYMAERDANPQSSNLELILVDGRTFPHPGKIGAIDADFNPGTGSIAFRVDFPNPDGLLRHGQSGTVVLNRALKNAILIPQRATFENNARRYVHVVGKDHVAHRREIVIQGEIGDRFVLKSGVSAGERIILEGDRLIHDGDKVE